jgi:hypothetical protein
VRSRQLFPAPHTVPRLDHEYRLQVGDCLRQEGLPVKADRLIENIEASMARFLSAASNDPLRSAHNALRQLWKLSHDKEPSVGLLRTRIRALPRRAVEYMDRRAQYVIPSEEPITRFQEWAIDANPADLISATRVLSAEGARWVKGRSRGSGNRSAARLEPMIMGVVRGEGGHYHTGGAPSNDPEHELVMFLAADWLCATDHDPKPGRGDNTGFGALVHMVFQSLDRPEGSAAYALRRYWAEVERGRRSQPSNISGGEL